MSPHLDTTKIYDNGGATFDRYTAVYFHLPEHRSRKVSERTYSARGMSENPFHPQGFGQWTTAMPGKHLGKQIEFEQLPPDCQRLVLQDLKPD